MRRTISRQRPVDRTIPAGTPPSSVPIAGAPVIGITPTDADVDKASAVPQCVSPTTGVRVVYNVKAPSKRARVVINRPDPRTINVTCPVHYSSVISVRADIAGRVAYIKDCRSGAVNLNIAHVVNRTTRRNRLYGIGDAVGDDPGPFRPRPNEPYGIVANVVLAADLEYRRIRVRRVLNVRAGNVLELRIAVVAHFCLGIAACDRGGLRNLRIHHCVVRLVRSRHRSECVSNRRSRSDLLEGRRELIAALVSPGPVQRFTAEPAS